MSATSGNPLLGIAIKKERKSINVTEQLSNEPENLEDSESGNQVSDQILDNNNDLDNISSVSEQQPVIEKINLSSTFNSSSSSNSETTNNFTFNKNRKMSLNLNIALKIIP